MGFTNYKRIMEIFKISKYRSQLMGLAILLVIFRHTRDFLATDIYINTFWGLGYCGVDIFFLLSGFGLFLGYKENDTAFGFWARRIKRIMPTYVIVNILFYLLMKEFNPLLICFSISGFGFFCNKPYLEWYIPSLMSLYLLFPFFMYVIKRYSKIVKTIVLMGIGVGLVLELVLVSFQRPVMLHLFISRLPIFFGGILLGVIYKNNSNFRLPALTIVMVSIISLVVEYYLQIKLSYDFLWANGLFWLPFILIIPGIIIIFIYVLEKTSNWFLTMFDKLGKVSLEMYLLHLSFLNIYRQLIDEMFSNSYGSWIAIVITILFIIVVYYFSVLLKRMTTFISLRLFH